MNIDGIVDASVLITLEDVELLRPLQSLFNELIVPPAVEREVARSVIIPDWLVRRAPAYPIDASILAAELGAGETEVVALAAELSTHIAILDDRAGRRYAARAGLPLLGTLGLLLRAKEAGLIHLLRPHIERLIATGFYASPSLVRQVLHDAGET